MSPLVLLISKHSGLNILRAAIAQVQNHIEMVITYDDSSDSRSCLDEITNVCEKHNIILESIYPKSLSQVIGGNERKTILVCGWYSLIEHNLLDKHDFYGFHYSYLPKYRGNAPLVWQIINGEENIGVTLFKFSDGIDDGPIVEQGHFKLHSHHHVLQALELADSLSQKFFKNNIKKILKNEVQLQKQDESGATYCGRRVPDDGKIDWTQSAQQIINFIRAQSNPYPGAFTYDQNQQKIYIYDAVIEPRLVYAPVGAVFDRTAEFVCVKCGEGSLKITMAETSNSTKLLEVFNSLTQRLV